MSTKMYQAVIGGLWLAGTVSWCSIATAAEPEDIIKYRQGVMKSVGGHMGALAQIVRGKVDYPDDTVYHAESIARSLKTVDSLFPPNSDFGETRALEAVWSKPEEFKKAGQQAGKAASEFVEAVKSGNNAALPSKFKALGDACKACHKDFRQEEE